MQLRQLILLLAACCISSPTFVLAQDADPPNLASAATPQISIRLLVPKGTPASRVQEIVEAIQGMMPKVTPQIELLSEGSLDEPQVDLALAESLPHRRVVSLCSLMQELDVPIRSLRSVALPPQNALVEVVSLKTVAAEEMKQILDALFQSEYGQIAADLRTNTLVIRGNEDRLRVVREVVRRIDTPSDRKSPPAESANATGVLQDQEAPWGKPEGHTKYQISVFALQHANATTTAANLLHLFDQDRVRVAADPVTNRIVVRSPETKTDEIHALIGDLDHESRFTPPKTPSPAVGEIGGRTVHFQLHLKTDEPQLKQIRAKAHEAEQRCLALARAESVDHAALREAVRHAFHVRSLMQQAELELLVQRMSQLHELLRAREAAAEQIVERRVEELLRPQMRWAPDDTALRSPEILESLPSVENVGRQNADEPTRQTTSPRSGLAASQAFVELEQQTSESHVLQMHRISPTIDPKLTLEVVSQLLGKESDSHAALNANSDGILVEARPAAHNLIRRVLAASELETSSASSSSPAQNQDNVVRVHRLPPTTDPQQVLIIVTKLLAGEREIRIDLESASDSDSMHLVVLAHPEGHRLVENVLDALSSEAPSRPAELEAETTRQVDNPSTTFKPGPVELPENLAQWLNGQAVQLDIQELAPGQLDYLRGVLQCSGRYELNLSDAAFPDRSLNILANKLSLRPSAEAGQYATSVVLTASGDIEVQLDGATEIECQHLNVQLKNADLANGLIISPRKDVCIRGRNFQLNCEEAYIEGARSSVNIAHDVEIVQQNPDGSKKVDFARDIAWPLGADGFVAQDDGGH